MVGLLDNFDMVRGVLLDDHRSITGMVDSALIERKIDHCFFRVLSPGNSVSADRYVAWSCVSASSNAGDDAVFLGEAGQLAQIKAGSVTEARITGPDIAIRNRGPLRALRKIDQFLFAVGMNWQVYRGSFAGGWSNISCPAPEGIVGFEAVDGFDIDEVYCVGWDGAIWWFDHGTWHMVDSPTNVVLTGVCCAQDGVVYAAARNGLILTGRRGDWKILEQDTIVDDVWSIAQAADAIYFATNRVLFRFDGHDIMPIRTPAATFFDLHAASGAVLSIGAKDAVLFDGTTWQKLL